MPAARKVHSFAVKKDFAALCVRYAGLLVLEKWKPVGILPVRNRDPVIESIDVGSSGRSYVSRAIALLEASPHAYVAVSYREEAFLDQDFRYVQFVSFYLPHGKLLFFKSSGC